VIAFIGLLVGYLLLLRFAPVVVDDHLTRARNREARALLLITLAQGAIGYTQYFTGVPELLVMAHLLGVVILWSALVRHGIRTHAFVLRAHRASK
jgi:cytochrome c oxidase assembly protein subunit 15